MDSQGVTASPGPLPNSTGTLETTTEYYYSFHDIAWLGYYSFKVEVFLALRVLCVFGWVGNLLIIRTFLKIGLTDCVSIVLFNLAIIDFNSINTIFVMTMCQLSEYVPYDVFRKYKVQPYAIEMICSDFILGMFGSLSIYNTTFVAVQRCFCVIKPLQFNWMFTRFKTIVIICLLWAYSLHITFAGSPFREIKAFRWWNITWLTIIYKPVSKWNDFITYHQMALGALHGICQVVVIVCIFIMVRELRRSVRFRQSASASATKATTQKQQELKSNDKLESSSSKSNDVGYKERRVTIQVFLVATIFIVTNFHRLLFEVVCEMPGMWDVFTKNWYFYKLYFNFADTLYLANASVNFLIYYTYNTKFRQLCFKR